MAEFGRTNAGAIVNAISTALRFFGGRIDKALRRVLDGLREGLIQLGTELAKFATQTGLMMAKVVGLLRRFWARVLLPLLRRLDRWATVVQTWLRETFGPIVRALLWLRAKILEIYTRWLRPIFDTIDVIRRVLSVLSLLQLEWARRLDRKLAELEDRLLTPIRLVIAKVNEAIEIIDRVITLDGLFQRIALIKSLVRDAELAWNALLGPKVKGLTPAETAAAKARKYERDETRTLGRELGAYYARGDGAYAGIIGELAPTWKEAARLEQRL